MTHHKIGTPEEWLAVRQCEVSIFDNVAKMPNIEMLKREGSFDYAMLHTGRKC